MYVLCFTRPRDQVSVYRTVGPLVIFLIVCFFIKTGVGLFMNELVIFDINTCAHI